jgi:hypothetical protein
MQTIFVYIIFALVLVYAGWKIYKTITHKEKASCSKCENPVASSSITTLKKD